MRGTVWNVWRSGDREQKFPTLSTWPSRGLAEADAQKRSLDGRLYVVERDNDHSTYWVTEYKGGEQRRRRRAAAMEATAAREPLEERTLHDGLAWYAEGPRGRQWLIAWQPARGPRNVRAWPLDRGRISPLYRGTAGSEDEARAEAARIAGEIRAGVRPAAGARDAATVAALEGESRG